MPELSLDIDVEGEKIALVIEFGDVDDFVIKQHEIDCLRRKRMSRSFQKRLKSEVALAIRRGKLFIDARGSSCGD